MQPNAPTRHAKEMDVLGGHFSFFFSQFSFRLSVECLRFLTPLPVVKRKSDSDDNNSCTGSNKEKKNRTKKADEAKKCERREGNGSR